MAKRRKRGEAIVLATSPVEQTSLSVNSLDQLSDEWLSYLENNSVDLSQRFDKLSELRKVNSVLEKTVKDCASGQLNDFNQQIGVKSDNIDECLSKAIAIRDQLKTECSTLKEEVKRTKTEKSKAERDLKKIVKQMATLETQIDEQKTKSEQIEHKVLAEVMQLKYTLTSGRGMVTLYFNDRKRNDKLVRSENEDPAKDFWSYLYKKYSI